MREIQVQKLTKDKFLENMGNFLDLLDESELKKEVYFSRRFFCRCGSVRI